MERPETRMIDVSAKRETSRLAIARARLKLNRSTFNLIKKNKVPKGDVLAVAQAAGIMAAKQTPDLIPLCHPLLLNSVAIDFTLVSKDTCIDITATIKGKGKTGFEMEALTAAAIAALTIYDMCKMLDKAMRITDLYLVKKTGGKSGTYIA
ncbi:MAG: cyclic pyranopterin monophosphate synthase MoaC [Dehalococcoidia bacterium]|jgi:cyclic pyranopterin monophosphate synthase